MLHAHWTSRLADTVLSTDDHRRIRLRQFFFSVAVYLFSAIAMTLGVLSSLLPGVSLGGWWLLVASTQMAFYALLRSGWSERLADPSLTEAQIVVGLLTVLWGYLVCGPLRSAALFPMMLILTFGAFSLTGWRMVALTAFGLVGLAVSIVLLHQWHPGVHDLHVDIANMLGVSIMLPACSVISTRLSVLRTKLQGQRAELAQALADVQRLATRDDLTGLVNRRFLLDLLAQEMPRSDRSGQYLCIALLDIDHFKRVNDTHGHAAGDAVLRAFANEALGAIRASDSLARWGGEEFLLMLPATDLEAALHSVERLRQRIAALPMETGGATLHVTVSIGLVQRVAQEAAADAIARADQALYAAKTQGRNRVVVA